MADLLGQIGVPTMAPMTRPKTRPDARVPQEAVQLIGRELSRRLPNYDTQADLGASLGISQAQVSRFISTVREKNPATYSPGNDVVSLVAGKLGIEYEGPRVGMRRAGLREADDMLPNRGRALDILSEEYPKEMLADLKKSVPPPGHEKWTCVRWLDWFLRVKSLLDTRD